MSEEAEPMLTVPDVARLLAMTANSVYKLVELGRLDAAGLKRIGPRCLRFHRPTLLAWMAGQGSERPRRKP